MQIERTQKDFSHSNTIAMQSVDKLIDQCYQAWDESKKISIPSNYKDIDNILVCGMGGSNWSYYIVSSVFETKVPMLICESYTLPSWASSKTLVILSSYSGNTEETLSCAEQAEKHKCKIVGLTSGGKLKEFLVNGNHPHYCFEPRYNPSGLPRFGIGYGIFGLLGLLAKLELINKFNIEDLDQQFVDSVKNLGPLLGKINKSVEDLVEKVKDQILLIFTAEHLKGNGHVFTNQLNETAKNLTFSANLPDSDHNLIEGFRKEQTRVSSIFIDSKSYLPRIKERFEITGEAINRNGYNSYYYNVEQGRLMQEMLDVLLFTSYFSVKLAVQNNVDPLAIPTIDFIKNKMSLTRV